MFPILGLIAVLATSTTPGTLITFNAGCTYTSSGTSLSANADPGYTAVLSPLYIKNPSPVYLTLGYDPLANGRVVRFIQKDKNGVYQVYQGIQLNDSRIMVDGTTVTTNQ